METKLTNRTDTTATLAITLDSKTLDEIKAEVYNHLRTNVKAAGFRPGKAPDLIVERELGSAAVQGEFIEHAIQHTYTQAVKSEQLPVITSPRITVEKFVPYSQLEYRAEVELMPKVKLGDYQKIRVKRPSVTVDDAEIDKTVEELRRREAVRLDSEQPAKLGDELNFDFAGTKDGQPVQGATAQGQVLRLGSGNFIPGFEEELTGLTKDSEKTFDIRFPKEYHEASLANQVVTFKVKVNSVTDLVMPELDDDFIHRVSPFKTLQQLRDDIADRIKGEKEEGIARQYEQEVLDKLLKSSTFQAPDALVRQQMERMRGELQQNLAYSGLDIEKYLELTKKSTDDLDSEMRPEAERRVGLAMVLTEVASAENLSVAPDELQTEVDRLKADYPDPKTRAELDNPDTREEVYNHLMSSKVIAKLLEFAEK